MKITKEKELKIDYLTRQLNKNNTYSEDPNRKGDPKMGTMPLLFRPFFCSKKINREGGIFRSLHEKQEGELIFLLMLLQKLRAYLVIVLKEVKCSVCQEGV